MARRKRKKAAPAGRVLATGLSATAMLGIVAAMAAQPPPSWELATSATVDGGAAASPATVSTSIATAATLPATTIVTRVEQRVIKVYDDDVPVGNAAAAPAAPRTGAAPAPAPAPVAGAPAPQPTPQPAPAPAPAPPPTVAPTPPPVAPTTAAPVPKCKASKC